LRERVAHAVTKVDGTRARACSRRPRESTGGRNMPHERGVGCGVLLPRCAARAKAPTRLRKRPYNRRFFFEFFFASGFKSCVARVLCTRAFLNSWYPSQRLCTVTLNLPRTSLPTGVRRTWFARACASFDAPPAPAGRLKLCQCAACRQQSRSLRARRCRTHSRSYNGSAEPLPFRRHRSRGHSATGEPTTHDAGPRSHHAAAVVHCGSL